MSSQNKHALDLKRFENVSEKTVYIIGDAGLLAGHAVYLVLFLMFEVKAMAAYNVFSICFYAGLAVLISRADNRNPLIFAALVEIMVHSCLGIYFLGWDNGFGLFLLFIMPIPFYMSLKRLVVPYLLSIIPAAIFIVMKLAFGRPGRAVYTFYTPVINNVFYLINVLFSSLLLIYISSIYMINREIMQQRLKSHNEELVMLATIDPLTELFNRRAMMDFLRMIQSKSADSGKPYVIGLSDIDDFKHINDTYGHDAGDAALQIAAKIMAMNVPAEGYIARWGGEEFLFAVPGTDLDTGIEFTERIRGLIEEERFGSGESEFGITITIGICEAAPGADFEKMISTADGRLYKGKSAGKNCVVSE